MCFHLGDEEHSALALQRLKDLEPDFSLDLMADPQYPVVSLWDTPLMRVTRSALL